MEEFIVSLYAHDKAVERFKSALATQLCLHGGACVGRVTGSNGTDIKVYVYEPAEVKTLNAREIKVLTTPTASCGKSTYIPLIIEELIAKQKLEQLCEEMKNGDSNGIRPFERLHWSNMCQDRRYFEESTEDDVGTDYTKGIQSDRIRVHGKQKEIALKEWGVNKYLLEEGRNLNNKGRKRKKR
jgi:hypothetical protein